MANFPYNYSRDIPTSTYNGYNGLNYDGNFGSLNGGGYNSSNIPLTSDPAQAQLGTNLNETLASLQEQNQITQNNGALSRAATRLASITKQNQTAINSAQAMDKNNFAMADKAIQQST